MDNVWVDLRSDTVTKPTPDMLSYMLKAEVGDDVFKEDPTVNKLEEMAADMFKHEAALFCSSGTMSNQLAVHLHCRPGDELICDELSHVYQYESGALATNSGVQVKLIKTDDGYLQPQQIINAINPNYDWLTHSRLVVIENTGNKWGGNFYTLSQLQEISNTCKQHNLALHCDGARIFNACIAGNYTTQQVGDLFNSLSVCLSKGLGAPVGSLLIGNKDFIKEARRVRKRWGGGMRQIGYLAAAGIFALQHNVERLKEDHQKALQIADILTKVDEVKHILPVKTNIVIAELDQVNPLIFLSALEKNKIKATQFGKRSVRIVTHLDINNTQLNQVISTLKNINLYL